MRLAEAGGVKAPAPRCLTVDELICEWTRLEGAERAIDALFTRRASLRLDSALLALEEIEP